MTDGASRINVSFLFLLNPTSKSMYKNITRFMEMSPNFCLLRTFCSASALATFQELLSSAQIFLRAKTLKVRLELG